MGGFVVGLSTLILLLGPWAPQENYSPHFFLQEYTLKMIKILFFINRNMIKLYFDPTEERDRDSYIQITTEEAEIATYK